jgi:hypothetical protein
MVGLLVEPMGAGIQIKVDTFHASEGVYCPDPYSNLIFPKEIPFR